MIALAARYWHFIAIAVLVALLGVQSVRISALKSEHAEYIAESERAALLAVQQALAEQSRRQQAIDEEAEHARAQIKDLESTVATLADTGDGLRDELAAFQQRARTQPNAACGGKSKPGADPLDMLAGVLSRADREAAILAEYSDRLKIAGLACERSADQVAR
jgi:predicted RNase H-like nuclease (RuvC/YqgF family)